MTRPAGAEQVRPPAPITGAFPPVELQPHAWLRDPWPVLPPVPVLPCLLQFGDRPVGAALITGEPHRDQPLVDDIGATWHSLRSTICSTLAMNGSINLTLPAGANGSPPASRTSTDRATVLASTPANFAADHAHPVRS